MNVPPNPGSAVEGRLQEVLEATTDCVVVMDRDFRIVFVNRRAADLAGVPSEKLLGLTHWEAWPVSVATEVERRYRLAMASGDPQEFEYRYVEGDMDMWLEIHAHPSEGGLSLFYRDVTQRRREREELDRVVAESDRQKRLYETVLSNTPDLEYVWDLDHRFLYANEALLRMWGRTAEEAIGKHCLELGYEPWHAEMHDREIEQVVATKRPVRGVVPFEGTNGRRMYDYILVPVIGEDGKVEAVAGTTRDVTESRQSQESLRQSEERFRLVARATHDAVWDWDLRADSLWWNEGVTELFGYDPAVVEPTIGWWHEHIHPEDRERVVRGVRRVLDSELSEWEDEYRYLAADGAYVLVHDQGHVVRDAAGKVVRMVGAMVDVTERRAAEERLRESEQRFRLMADTVPQIVWITDAEGRVEFFNRQWSDYTGQAYWPATAAEVAATALHPDDGAETNERFQEALRSGTTFRVEHRIRSASGEYRWFLVRGEPYRDPQTGRIAHWFGTSVDIHDRKTAEEALWVATGRLDAVLSAAEVGVWHYDAATGTIGADANLAAMFGLPAEVAREADAATFIAQIHPDDQAMVAERFGRAVAEGTPYEVEYRVVGGGQERWVVARGFADRDDAGRVVRMPGAVLDITATKAAQARERAALEALERITEGSRDHIMSVDRAYRFTSFNGAYRAEFARIYGSEPQIGESILDRFVHLPEDRANAEAMLGRALGGEQMVLIAEFGDPARERFLYELSFYPVRDGQGAVVGAAHVARNVTERVRAEDALRASEELFRTVFEEAPDDAIVVTDAERRILAWNPAAERICGWTAEEALGQRFDLIFTPEDCVQGAPEWETETAARDGKAIDERWHLKKDGSHFWGSGTTSALRASDGSVRGYMKVFRDATERRELERVLETRVDERTRELVAKNQELEGFTYSVSHDMRAPLRAMVANARIALEEEGPKLSPEGRHNLDRLANAAVRMSELVDDLLQYARLGTRELRRNQVDLAQLARDTAREVVADRPECDLVLNVACEATVDCDPRLIGMALHNLLDNACKYRKADEPAKVDFRCEEREGERTFSLRDHGIGFDMRYAHKLFQPFERLHREEYAGTGIGLANVKRAIERHGGRVWAEGELGKGSTFYFTLP